MSDKSGSTAARALKVTAQYGRQHQVSTHWPSERPHLLPLEMHELLDWNVQQTMT